MCPELLQFGAILFIVNLLIKADYTVICVACSLSMFVMSHFVMAIGESRLACN